LRDLDHGTAVSAHPRAGVTAGVCRLHAEFLAQQLNVSDHGPVIVAEARELLFSTFYRVPGQYGAKGTGLGLALVRQIARRHAGDVAYNPERGSCFTVTLPAIA
jgi:signal transduction histidine kinase